MCLNNSHQYRRKSHNKKRSRSRSSKHWATKPIWAPVRHLKTTYIVLHSVTSEHSMSPMKKKTNIIVTIPTCIFMRSDFFLEIKTKPPRRTNIIFQYATTECNERRMNAVFSSFTRIMTQYTNRQWWISVKQIFEKPQLGSVGYLFSCFYCKLISNWTILQVHTITLWHSARWTTHFG